MKSKEEKILKLFFNHPTKEWHFEEIIKEACMARSKAGNWLKKLRREKIIKKVKEKKKMPYYISNYEAPFYRNKKKIFAMTALYNAGLLNHLGSLEKAKAVILFGSFSRSDWYKNSDIDIFFYGDIEGLKIAQYEMRLQRDIQIFHCETKEDLSKLGVGLLKNIIKGNVVKGNLDFLLGKVHCIFASSGMSQRISS